MKYSIFCIFAAVVMLLAQAPALAQLEGIPSELDFGTMCVEDEFLVKTITLINNSQQLVTVDEVRVVGATPSQVSEEGFAVDGGAGIPPSGSYSLNVFFQAQESGLAQGVLKFDVDGVENSVNLIGIGNEAPTAVAAVQKLVDVGGGTILRLDGSGSSDLDDPNENLIFCWMISNLGAGGVMCDFATDKVDVPVTAGLYQVTLVVSDPSGCFDETTKTVNVGIPSCLSSFHQEKVKVEWNKSPGSIKISGEIGLPSGVYSSDVFPMLSLRYTLAKELIVDELLLAVPSSNGRKWKYHDHGVVEGIHKLDIDWKGARYEFKEKGFPVQLKSEMIASTDTILTVKLKKKEIDGPFSIKFNGTAAVVSFDSDAMVDPSGTDVAFVEEKPGKEVTLTLPFPLDASSEITMCDGVVAQLDVEDDLKDSVGRFRLDLRFDADSFECGVDTDPLRSYLEVFIGEEGFLGTSKRNGANGLKRKKNKWEAK